MENPSAGLLKTETTVKEQPHEDEVDATLATGLPEMDASLAAIIPLLKAEPQDKSESSTGSSPLGQLIFSDSINRPRIIKAHAIKLLTAEPTRSRLMLNSSTNTASFTKGHLTGHVPLTSLFHMESNRENKGPDDDGLEDADLTAADGVIRAKKASQRKLILPSDSMKIIKGEFTFPHKTYKPKCQIAFRVPAGQVPQAVMAERLHRIYKKTDINLVLQTLGIELSDLIPPPNYGETNERFYHEMMFRNRIKINGTDKKDVLARGGRFKQYGFNEDEEEGTHIHKLESDSTISTDSDGSKTKSKPASKSSTDKHDEEDEEQNKSAVHPFIQNKPPFNAQFPLSYFDNAEYDIRSGEDWCRLGWDEKEKKFSPLPGKALLPFPFSFEKRQRIKAPSEANLDELLRKSPRLEKFRSWLLRQRYIRQLKMVGLDPAKMMLRLAPSELEMAIVARLGSVVETVTSFSDEYSEGRASKDIRHSNRRKSTVDAGEIKVNLAPKNVDSDDYESGDDEPSPDQDAGKTQEVVERDEEYLNIIFKLRQPKKDDDLSDDDDRALTTKDDAKRSISLLSDVFSDIDSLTMLGSDIITNTQAGAGKEADTTFAEDIDEDSEDSEGKLRRLNKPARSYFLGDYGINMPSSPDFDPFEDGLDQYVMDYDKMKKVHIYDWRWVDVAVFDYDPAENKYFVRSIFPPIVYAWVSKVYLVFDAEDPNRHGLRIKDAVKRRIEMENIMRYNLYIDCLPVIDFPRLDNKTFENIFKYVTKTSNIVYTDVAMVKVQKEINLEFQRAIAEEKFETLVEKHQKTFKPWVQIPDKQETAILTNINDHVQKTVHAPHDFLPSIHLQNFEYKVKNIQKNTIIYTNEAWKPYYEITNICQDAKEKSFIITSGLEPMYLADWEQTQLNNMDELRRYLKDEWYESVMNNIIVNFEKLNQSWYSVVEKNYDVFLMSKLFNFLQLVKLLMQDTIRSIIKDSCSGFMLTIKAYSVGIDFGTDWSWGDDLTKSNYPSPQGLMPIWILEMYMDPVDGPKYTQPLASYYKTVYALLCQAIQSSSNDMPTFLTRIMPQMKFVPVGFLQGVDENEEVMVDLGYNLVKYTKLVLVPLETYIRKYKRYKQVWTLDIADYISQLEATDPTAQDIRKLVDQHKRHMEKLEKEIPIQIEITAFRIIVEQVRTAILTKKRTLITSILTSYAEKLKRIIQRVLKEYIEMEKKLTLRSDDIEEVMELKGYAEIIPSLVARLDLVTSAVKKDYEVFDHFLYEVPDEDINAKWQAALSSNKMLRLQREAIRLLEEDYDRLLKVQQAELGSLSDQVDSATLAVAGLVAFTDIDTTNDVCQELNKIMKTIEDLQVQSALLNRRQRVFNLPMAQNEALHRLTRDIEPFKHLWFTASEWLDVQNTLYKGSLHDVDINQVMKVIHDGGKVIGRCIRYFAGANQIQHSAKLIKHQLEEFKPLVPLVGVLNMTEMRLRHWEAITTICGFPVDESGHQNFKELLDLGIREHVSKITEIGELAFKEFEIEQALDTMKKGIAEHHIIMSFDKELKVRTVIIKDETMQKINEYIGVTNILLENPYNPPFEDELGTWNRKIKLCKVNLELWTDNQNKWLNIQPRFQAPDAAVKLKVTYKVFERMQRIWRRLTRLARDNPELLELASDNTTAASLQQFSKLLVNIQKTLEELMRPKGSDESDDD